MINIRGNYTYSYADLKCKKVYTFQMKTFLKGENVTVLLNNDSVL